MIPFLLQDKLVERMEKEFEHFRLKDPQQDPVENEEEQLYVPLNIYRQELPEKPADDVTLYPYLRIELSDGREDAEEGPHLARVLFTVAVYDRDSSYQGYKYLSTIMQKVYENLKRWPIIDKIADLQYPIQWMFHEEDLYPFFFGGLVTNWSIAQIMRDDIGEMI